MKLFKPISAIVLMGIWIIALSVPIGKLPPLGNFLSPGIGFWASATPDDQPQQDFQPLKYDSILQKTTIVFDNRLVPHIKAANDFDLYYVQGYIQAYYRLWQMDMQTRAAAGRVSEVVGKTALNYDRHQRRKGMVWAAEKSLKTIEANPETKTMLNAYTAGVNAYIHSLNYKQFPLEYKLMDFRPEAWTPLKCVLLMKFMADDLSGKSDDIAMSYVRQALPPDVFNLLYPEKLKSSDPVIPRGTIFSPASLTELKNSSKDMFAKMPYQKHVSAGIIQNNESGIGSNNWVINGQKTKSGNSILCNDPHLGLNMPSIWFETQLTAPGINCYGVSIPGAPGIVIGFNDSISWGMTNNYRDVKDYYALKTNAEETSYRFDGSERPFRMRLEKIFIKGQRLPFIDTVRYAVQGPVEYDKNFPDPAKSGLVLAMAWMAHRGTNEFLALYLLNRARNYQQFVQAIQYFQCPAQNFIYADTKQNIAIWGQGQFVNEWPHQGRFVMRGDTSATLWGSNIPMDENPHILNPSQNYLESANQQITDFTYPYNYNGDFTEFRSWEITHFLSQDTKFTVNDMMSLQNNNWSLIANELMPLFRQYGRKFGKAFPDYFQKWNDTLTPDSKTGAAFQIWWNNLYQNLWYSRFRSLPLAVFPTKEITIQLILQDSQKLNQITGMSLATVAAKSFEETEDSLKILTKENKALWYQIKNTSITHLAKIPAFSYAELPTGGSGTTINAMRDNHGPSWRMIVEMLPGKIQAWCTYPGGQSGNPGSKYYNTFLQRWVDGDYYRIRFFQPSDYKKP